MATSGRRLRRARLGLAAALAGAIAVAAGAGVGHGRAAAAARPRHHWCEARSATAWRRVLRRHIVRLSRTTALVPWTLAHDGRSFFATVYSPGFSGVARVDATTNTLTKIKSFPDPKDDQADGAFDGRWLVWNEYHGFDSFDDFTVWAWDSRTGHVKQIGAATRALDGRFWPSTWRQPDVRNGIAAWEQGIGPNALAAVHAYDLRSGRDRIVRRGFADGPFLLAGHLVAWPESPNGRAATRIYVASALTGKRVRTPRALRTLRGVSALVTDGRRIAYPNAQYKSLWWSPSLALSPELVVSPKGIHHVDNSVQIGGRYIGFGIEPRVFIGDTKTRRYVQISGQSGWTRVDSTSLLVLYATGSKALDAHSPIAFVRLRDLPPMPACP